MKLRRFISITESDGASEAPTLPVRTVESGFTEVVRHRTLAGRREANTFRAVSVAEKQQSLVELFGAIPDPQEKLSAIVEWSKRVPRLPASARTQENRVPGCVSPVWVVLEPLPSFAFRVRADAESPVVRALVCVLAEVYDGAEAAEIVKSEPTLLDELGVTASLSFTRRNGLLAVRHRIRESARASTVS